MCIHTPRLKDSQDALVSWRGLVLPPVLLQHAGFPGFGVPAPGLCESPVGLQAAPAAARTLPVDASEDSSSDGDSDAPNLASLVLERGANLALDTMSAKSAGCFVQESMYSEALHNASGESHSSMTSFVSTMSQLKTAQTISNSHWLYRNVSHRRAGAPPPHAGLLLSHASPSRSRQASD